MNQANKPSEETQTPVGLPAGTRVAKYEIVEKIGVGGQAVVYKGYDPVLDRAVTIKQISTHLAADARFVAQFRQEAKILAQLGGEDTSIVAVYDLVENESGLFIVMEYVHGHSLHDVLSRQRYAMPVKVATEILWRIAKGLNAAHSAGIVHRDVKPGNIIISRDYSAKITDFGVAAQAGGEASLAMGTTKYMAPEIFGGPTAVDARADIYSLGFIAYEMLTGREYFVNLFADVLADPATETLRWMKWHSDKGLSVPPLAKINPKVSKALSNVVMRMMAKDLDRRYASVAELMRDLRAATRPPKHKNRRAAVAVDQPPSPELLSAPTVSTDVEPEPLTARLPASPADVRKRILIAVIVALAVALGGAAVALVTIGRQENRRSISQTQYRDAKSAFESARSLYQAGDVTAAAELFAKSLTQFERIAADYGDLDPGVNADARVQMCRAWAAMLTGQWAQAAQFAKQAADRKILSNEEILAFQGFLSARRSAAEYLDAAAAAMDNRRLEEATSRLAAFGRIVGPPDDLNRKAEDLRGQLDKLKADARIRREFDRKIRDGDAALAQAKSAATAGDAASAAGDQTNARARYGETQAQFTTARDLYLAARTILDDPAVTQRLKDLDETEALTAYNRAVAQKDLAMEIVTLGKVLAIRPTPQRVRKLNDLKAERDYQRALKLMASGNAEDLQAAKAALTTSLEHLRRPKTEQAMTRVDNEIKRLDLMLQADVKAQAGQYDQAGALLNEAAEIRAGQDVTERLAAVRGRSYVAAAEAARKARQWDQALAAYEQLRQLDADNPAAVSAAEQGAALVVREKRYYAYLDAGKRFLTTRQYGKAAAQFRKAVNEAKAETSGPLLITADEADELKTEALYAEQLERGQAARAAGELNSALAFFRMAQRHRDTPEIRKRIAQVEAALK